MKKPTPACRPGVRPGQYFQSPEAGSCAVRAHSLIVCLNYAVSLLFPSLLRKYLFFCLRNPTRLACDSKLQPIKIKQFFGTGMGYGKVKRQGNVWLPRRRKECAALINHYQLYDCEYSSVVDRLRSLAKQFTTEIFTTDVKLKAGTLLISSLFNTMDWVTFWFVCDGTVRWWFKPETFTVFC